MEQVWQCMLVVPKLTQDAEAGGSLQQDQLQSMQSRG